ncbi:MAG: DNA polymerase III subunit gamma/tau, partial [Duganella sp.]
IEVDAASRTKVDDTRELLENVQYSPTRGRYKVYLVDEVHMLSTHSFNALLKTLEEPPPHVKFLLATTDPQRLPVTVLSRCLQFNLKQMPPGHIIGHLDNILGQEGISFEQPALRLLAAGAHGSMRDALSLTDQAIAYAAGAVTLDAVQGMLGALDQSYLVRLLDALARQDGADLLAVADEMATRSLSYNGALQDLGTLLHRIALAQTVPAALPDDLPEYADIVRLASLFDAEEVQLYYQIAVHGRNELGLAPDEYAGFSMTLLRMLAFRPGVGGAEGQPAAAPVMSRPAAVAAARAAAAGGGSGGAAPPARAASNIQASHASVAPQAVVAGAAAALARSAAPASVAVPAISAMASPMHPPALAPAPAATPMPMPAQPSAPIAAADATPATPATPTPAALFSPARVAFSGGGVAARAAPRPGGRSMAPSPSAPSAPAAAASPMPAVSPAAAPGAGASHFGGSSASGASAVAAQPTQSTRPAPWDDMPAEISAGGAAVLEAPVQQIQQVQPVQAVQHAPQQVQQRVQQQAQPPAPQQASADDDLPPWVTEFSDDSAVAHGAPAYAASPAQSQALSAPTPGYGAETPIVMPARAPAAPSRAPYAYVITPVPALNWDGNWPAVAASLPLRGVAQQLAMQAELIQCSTDGNATVFQLRVPIETWRTPGNVEKLTLALNEHFGRPVRVDTELGAVWYTASAEAQAFRAACLKAAEQTVANDPFVNSLIREFDAWVVPGSIVPPPQQQQAAG